MKKIVLTLSVLLVLILALAMTSCGGTTETTTATTTTEAPITTEAPLPEGYALYDNGDISFAYPESFVKTDGSTVILTDMTTGNNVTVVYEAKTDMYETLDNNGYKTMFKPAFEAMGMSISKYNVEQIAKNAKGISLTKVTHTASTQGKTMEQTMLITTVGNKTYTVTVTEVVNNDAFVNNVLNSLGLSK